MLSANVYKNLNDVNYIYQNSPALEVEILNSDFISTADKHKLFIANNHDKSNWDLNKDLINFNLVKLVQIVSCIDSECGGYDKERIIKVLSNIFNLYLSYGYSMPEKLRNELISDISISLIYLNSVDLLASNLVKTVIEVFTSINFEVNVAYSFAQLWHSLQIDILPENLSVLYKLASITPKCISTSISNTIVKHLDAYTGMSNYRYFKQLIRNGKSIIDAKDAHMSQALVNHIRDNYSYSKHVIVKNWTFLQSNLHRFDLYSVCLLTNECITYEMVDFVDLIYDLYAVDKDSQEYLYIHGGFSSYKQLSLRFNELETSEILNLYQSNYRYSDVFKDKLIEWATFEKKVEILNYLNFNKDYVGSLMELSRWIFSSLSNDEILTLNCSSLFTIILDNEFYSKGVACRLLNLFTNNLIKLEKEQYDLILSNLSNDVIIELSISSPNVAVEAVLLKRYNHIDELIEVVYSNLTFEYRLKLIERHRKVAKCFGQEDIPNYVSTCSQNVSVKIGSVLSSILDKCALPVAVNLAKKLNITRNMISNSYLNGTRRKALESRLDLILG